MINDYLIVSATYLDADHAVILLQTSNFGAVMVSERDRPELWSNVLACGVPIADFVPEPEPEQAPPPQPQGGPRALA
jgi:hypothetical protein